jgi:hypothetical protein
MDDIGIERLEEHKHKGGILHSLAERLDDIVLILSLIWGLREKPPRGSDEEKRIPGWLLSFLYHFTREDNSEFNLILDSHSNPEARQVELKFRLRMIKDGWDVDYYRLGLVWDRREFRERMNYPPPEDKSSGRIKFGPMVVNDSSVAFLSELIEISKKYKTAEAIYRHQLKCAESRMLLKKTSLSKKIVSWILANKALAILILLVVLTTIICLPIKFLQWMIG